MKIEMFTASTSASTSTESITLHSIRQAVAKVKMAMPPSQALLVSKEDADAFRQASSKFNDKLDNFIMNGVPILESSFLPPKLVQKRTHRRSRINKKWRKKYGFKPPEKVAYLIDLGIWSK